MVGVLKNNGGENEIYYYQENDQGEDDYDENEDEDEGEEDEDENQQDEGKHNYYYDSDDQFYGPPNLPTNLYEIDRSFTDIGYVGYGDRINLDELDNTANWQFEEFIQNN